MITRYFCLSHCRAFKNSQRYYTKYYRNIIWFRTWTYNFFKTESVRTFYMYTYLLNALVFEWSVECRDGFVSWNLIFGYLEWVEKGLMPENFFISVLNFENKNLYTLLEVYWSFCRTFQLLRQSGKHFGFAAAMRQICSKIAHPY